MKTTNSTQIYKNIPVADVIPSSPEIVRCQSHEGSGLEGNVHWNRVHKKYLPVSSFVELRLNATLYPPAVIMRFDRHAVRSDKIYYFTEVTFLFPKK
jgi:hypothetical protein